MFRSLTGTIGAVLLGSAALFAPAQEQTPTKAAEQACYNRVKSQIGIDPQAPATAAAQTEQHAVFKKALSTCLQGRRPAG
jgi:hypothetical protein